MILERLSRLGIWLPLIAVDVQPRPNRIVEAIKAGALDYLSLPLEPERLGATLERIGDEARDQADARRRMIEARERIEACWDHIEAHLAKRGPYLLGPSVSAADFLLTMLMRWSRNLPRQATDWPQLGALAQRMKARPSFRLLYEREGLTEWA